MSYDSFKKDLGVFVGASVVAVGIFLLRFLGTINPVVAVFFAIFVGALAVVLKNVVIAFRYKEHQRISIGKSLIVFSGVAVASLVVTCILAAVLS